MQTEQQPPPPTSVQPEESNVESAGDPSHSFDFETLAGDIAWRHTHWRSTRRRTIDALATLAQRVYDTPPQRDISQRRLHAFIDCGSSAWVQVSRDDPNRFRITCARCHDRFCLPCANEKARVAAARLHAKIQGTPHRFLTLTLHTDTDSLADSLSRLLKSFRKLRQRAFWKRHVKGGIAIVEVTYNHDRKRWHPHLHVVVAGRYMAKADIGKEWYAVTGDSWIVDIRLIRDDNTASKYLAKYATKGYNASVTKTFETLTTALVAMRGRRLLITFGTWRGFRITDPESDESWLPVASLTRLRAQATDGDQEALWILAHITFPISLRSPPTDPRPPPPEQSIMEPDVLHPLNDQRFIDADWLKQPAIW